MRIAVVNQKGGVGKTSTAVSIAAGLAMASHRVLLLDLDGQASASVALGIGDEERTPGTPDVFLEHTPIRDAIRATSLPNLAIVPSDERMYAADVRLASAIGRDQRLAKALRPLGDAYDHIIFDCPPGFGVTMAAAVIAADALLVPVAPEALAIEGLAKLHRSLDQIRSALEIPLPILGYVITMASPGERATRELIAGLRDALGDAVCTTVIRRNVSLKEAPSHGLPIYIYAPESAGAQDYATLVVELVERMRGTRPAFPQTVAAGGPV